MIYVAEICFFLLSCLVIQPETQIQPPAAVFLARPHLKKKLFTGGKSVRDPCPDTICFSRQPPLVKR